MQAPASPDMSTRLEPFGAPRLRCGDRVVRLGSRKALALALVLALDGEQRRERLLALLWPDVEVAAARRNLRRDLFRLREAGVDIADGGGDILVLRGGAAIEWQSGHGRALDGLDSVAGGEFEGWLAARRADLEGARSQHWRQRAQQAADAGDVEGAIRHLEVALALDAGDERAAAQAIALHLKLGRPAAAEAIYERSSAALQQLDLPPSPVLRALIERPGRVDRTAPEPQPPASERGALIPAQIPYIDRPGLRARIEAAWDRGSRVYLAGPPGAGKTRLARECASARGAWLSLACEPNDALLAHASAVRALRALRAAAPDVELAPWMCRELAVLMPEFGDAPHPLPTGEARGRLVAALEAAFAALVQDNFQALVVDDWHWTDEASLDLWAAPGSAGVNWLIAFRSGNLPPQVLQRMRAEVDAGRAVAVDVNGFDEGEALALVRELSGSRRGSLFSARLRQATDGNPFFLIETLRHLADSGLLQHDPVGGWRTPFDAYTADYSELPIPATVRDAVLARARALGAPIQRLLEAASLLSDRFHATLLVDVSPLPLDAILDGLAHAGAAHLVREDADGFHFVHDLLRQCLADSLGATRRRALHARLAAALERSGAEPALVAAQWEAAGERAVAAPWRRKAGERALRAHALEQALDHYAAAVADAPESPDVSSLLRRCAEVHDRRGNRAEADAALVRAVAAARDDRVAALAAQVERAQLWSVDQADRSLAWLDAIAPDLGEAPADLRGRALWVRAAALGSRGRLVESEALLGDAIRQLDGLPGCRNELALLFDMLARCAVRRGDLDAALAHIDRCIGVLETTDAPITLAGALAFQGAVLLQLTRRAQAEAVLVRAKALAARTGCVREHRAAILNLVKIATDAGDVAQAVALLDEGEGLAPGFEHVRAEVAFREARFYVEYLLGNGAAARHQARSLLPRVDQLPGTIERIGVRVVVADLYLLDRDVGPAQSLLAEALALCEEQRRGGGGGGLYHAQCVGRMAWLRLETGRAGDALELLDAPPPTDREEDRVSLAWIASAALQALGRLDEAVERLMAAVPGDDVPFDATALWVAQALALAEAQPAWPARFPGRDLRQWASELVEQSRVPAQISRRLAERLAAAPR